MRMCVCTCTSVQCSSCSSQRDVFGLTFTCLFCAGKRGDLEDTETRVSVSAAMSPSAWDNAEGGPCGQRGVRCAHGCAGMCDLW